MYYILCLANTDIATTEIIIYWCKRYWMFLVVILVCVILLILAMINWKFLVAILVFVILLILAIVLHHAGYTISEFVIIQINSLLHTVTAAIALITVIILVSILHNLFPNVVTQSIVDVSIQYSLALFKLIPFQLLPSVGNKVISYMK